MTLPTDPRDEQTRIPQQAGAEPSPEPTGFAAPPAPRRTRRWPWIAAAVVVVLVAAGGVTYALMPSDEDTAVDRCQSEITGKLKSPSTAEFGEATVTAEEGNFASYYDVSGQVDAQNGFGAMVRGDYRCKVSRERDGRWVVTESSVTQG